MRGRVGGRGGREGGKERREGGSTPVGGERAVARAKGEILTLAAS